MKKSNTIFCMGLAALMPFFIINNKPKNSNVPAAITHTVFHKHIPAETGLAKVVALADAFKVTLPPEQVALLQLEYSKSNVVRWSNFPQMAARPSRVGVRIGTLSPLQMAAFKMLMGSVLVQNVPNEGFDEMEGVLAADKYFGKTTGKTDTFGPQNFFIAFLGKPSTTGLWELQFGGHHIAFADTYNKGKLIGATPSFRGVEPMKPVEANGKTYQPIDQEKAAFADVISSLTDAEKATAKLSTTLNDVLLGPGEDGNFPAKKSGIKVSALQPKQQAILIKAIERYVNDLDPATAKEIMKKYTAELPDTYVAYSGTGSMDKTADYIRIDGPGIWIEYAVQPSRDFPGTTHPHSVWRDHQSDYGGN